MRSALAQSEFGCSGGALAGSDPVFTTSLGDVEARSGFRFAATIAAVISEHRLKYLQNRIEGYLNCSVGLQVP